MSAKTNRARISIIPEVTWGTTPATPAMQEINWSDQSLDFKIETTTSNHKRDDRMVSDVIPTSAGAEGGWDFEMHYDFGGSTDVLFPAILWAAAWVGVDGATESMSAIGGVISGSTIDMNSAPAVGTMVVGQIFKLDSADTAANDNYYTVTDITSGVYTVVPAFDTDETLTSGTISGKMIRNGVTRHSFTIERSHLDIGEHFPFQGMVVNEFEMTVESEELIECSLSFVGKDTTVQSSEIGDSYIEKPTTDSMSSSFNIEDVLLDGVAISSCLLNSISISVNNQVTGKTGVGVYGFCGTSEDRQEVTGSITMYFNDSTVWQMFKDNQEFSLSFALYDGAGNRYVVTLPKLKLSEDTITGDDPDFMDDGSYTALAHAATGCQIQIDSFSA